MINTNPSSLSQGIEAIIPSILKLTNNAIATVIINARRYLFDTSNINP
jgi:hypothetical protein